MKKLSKEAKEKIWQRVNKLKEKYPTKEKKSTKAMSAKEVSIMLMKGDLIAGDWKGMVASLVIFGSFQFGCFEKSKEKIVSWINEAIDMTKKKTIAYFNKCWRNLEKNGVFKRGKIYANFDGECDGVELSLLICVAQGLVERSVR